MINTNELYKVFVRAGVSTLYSLDCALLLNNLTSSTAEWQLLAIKRVNLNAASHNVWSRSGFVIVDNVHCTYADSSSFHGNNTVIITYKWYYIDSQIDFDSLP